ncbi:MAG: SDR family NAD(P)-dependent oxidoreductase [Steroidobacteraceae bacterium]
MSTLDFGGRVAIVTGAGRGMGRSHAKMLASRGARVIVNDLPAAAGEESAASAVVREITAKGGKAVANHASVVDSGREIVQAAIDAFGRLDIVVCNAGVMSSASFGDGDPEEWQRVFNIHFGGTVGVLRPAWPHLVRSGTGRIITISSSGMLGNAGITSYGSAKAGIFGLTRSLACEGLASGIMANCIFPTARTRMADTIDDPAILSTLEKYFQPEHVSAMVVWLTHQDTHVTNQAFQVSGGRAGRLTMAAAPTVRVNESTPEAWAQNEAKLMADGPLTPYTSTAEMFGNELADADPEIRHTMGEKGGLALRTTEDFPT